jgi:hydrogenase maturation protease
MADNVLVAGVGNIFCTDDGFGSAVIDRLRGVPMPGNVRVEDYGIRGVHLAFDLADGVDVLILVDTIPDAGGPGELAVLHLDESQFGEQVFDAHSMDPGSVVRSLGTMTDRRPDTFVVGCQPHSTADGMGLTEAVASAVPRAATKIRELLDELCETGGPPPERKHT